MNNGISIMKFAARFAGNTPRGTGMKFFDACRNECHQHKQTRVFFPEIRRALRFWTYRSPVNQNPNQPLGAMIHQRTTSTCRTRSIPACAGQPQFVKDALVQAEVYPRVCGATERNAACGCSVPGLSPRVRGNPGHSGIARSADRSIPACAGQPECHDDGERKREVYPRVCGATRRWCQHERIA